jgi:hypothetical protein
MQTPTRDLSSTPSIMAAVFELKAEVAALAGGVFNHRGHAFGFSQRDIDGFGNARQALVLRDLLQMAAGMEVEQRQPELLAAAQFINKASRDFSSASSTGWPRLIR